MERPGYTLLELVTVVLILGILAGVALPRISNGQDEATLAATIAHLKTIALAAETYYQETGTWPADVWPAERPPELANYLRPNLFEVPCPSGGRYDWDIGAGGATAAVSINSWGNPIPDWAEIDAQIDDGSASTGWVVHGTNKLWFILER